MADSNEKSTFGDTINGVAGFGVGILDLVVGLINVPLGLVGAGIPNSTDIQHAKRDVQSTIDADKSLIEKMRLGEANPDKVRQTIEEHVKGSISIGFLDFYPNQVNEISAKDDFGQEFPMAYRAFAVKSLVKMKAAELSPEEAEPLIKSSLAKVGLDMRVLYDAQTEGDAIAAFNEDKKLAYKNLAIKYLGEMKDAKLSPEKAEPLIKSSLEKAQLDIRALYPDKGSEGDAITAFEADKSLTHKNFAKKYFGEMNDLKLKPEEADSLIKDHLEKGKANMLALYPTASSEDDANARYNEAFKQANIEYNQKLQIEALQRNQIDPRHPKPSDHLPSPPPPMPYNGHNNNGHRR